MHGVAVVFFKVATRDLETGLILEATTARNCAMQERNGRLYRGHSPLGCPQSAPAVLPDPGAFLLRCLSSPVSFFLNSHTHRLSRRLSFRQLTPGLLQEEMRHLGTPERSPGSPDRTPLHTPCSGRSPGGACK